MKNKILRDALIRLFVNRKHRGKDIVDEVKAVLALIAPYLDAAEKWKNLCSIPSPDNDCLNTCPLTEHCDRAEECLIVILLLEIENKPPTLGM